MRCPSCDKAELARRAVEHKLTVGGVEFVGTVEADVCPACNEELVSYDELHRFTLLVADLLARRGERVPERVRFMRKALGLKAVELARLLDVRPETVSRWESVEHALEMDPKSFALLGTLAADALAGRSDTRERLEAAVAPPTKVDPLRSPVRLAVA